MESVDSFIGNAIERHSTFEHYLNDLVLTEQDLAGQKVLDLGSGDPEFAGLAKAKGIDVVSVDLYKSVDPQGLSVVTGDAMRLPFKEESFDRILARGSVHAAVESVGQLKQLVGEAKRVLKPGGDFRFAPGCVEVMPLSLDEGNKVAAIFETQENGGHLTPEEDDFLAKIHTHVLTFMTANRFPPEEDTSMDAFQKRTAIWTRLTGEALAEIDPRITQMPTNTPERSVVGTNSMFVIPK